MQPGFQHLPTRKSMRDGDRLTSERTCREGLGGAMLKRSKNELGTRGNRRTRYLMHDITAGTVPLQKLTVNSLPVS